MIEIRQRENAIVFAVRVQPRSSRDEISGEWQGGLKIRLQAPPLCRFLAEILKIPASAVRILSGERSRTKRVEIRGVTAAQIQGLLIHDS